MLFIFERKTDSFSPDLTVNTPHICHSLALCDTKSSEKVPPVKTVNLRLRSVRAEGERKSLRLSLWVMSVTGSYAIWLHSCSLCRSHTKETPTLRNDTFLHTSQIHCVMDRTLFVGSQLKLTRTKTETYKYMHNNIKITNDRNMHMNTEK